MTRTGTVILVVSAAPQRRRDWQAAVRRAGHLPLTAASLRRAQELMQWIRPALVLADAALPDGRAATLFQALASATPRRHVPMVLHGALTSEEHAQLARGAYEVSEHASADDGAIRVLLNHVLGERGTTALAGPIGVISSVTARPRHRR